MPVVRGRMSDLVYPGESFLDREHRQRTSGAFGRKACDFCRKRKIKCDGDAPCSACVRLGRSSSCTVSELSRRERPTYKELDSANEQIKALQARLSSSNEPARDAECATQEIDMAANSTAGHTPSNASQNDFSPMSSLSHGVSNYENGEEARQARYHGPTSASFHDIQDDTQNQTQNSLSPISTSHKQTVVRQAVDLRTVDKPIAPLPDDDHLSTIVTAHAAHQQQAEMMNVLAGRLDFDGIEPELTMHLLSLHWNRQHHAFLVTYRPLFMRDMAAGATGRYFSKLLLHAILFGASKFSDRTDKVRADISDPSSAGARFLRRIEMLLPEALMTSRITTVQALLLLACTHFARGAESAAWLHSGLAFRMAADLGLFVNDGKELVAAEKMAPEEMELRRRVAWAAYTIDKIHSLYQGRQVSIRAIDIGVPASFIDKFEEQEYWTPIAYQSGMKARVFACPVYSVSTFTQLCKLTMILEEIIESFYGVKSAIKPKASLLEDLRKLHGHLQDWFDGLPVHLAMDFRTTNGSSSNGEFDESKKAVSPNVISLHALYQCLVLLLHRPFLPYGHLYDRCIDPQEVCQDDTSGLTPVARSAWKTCVDAAWQISHLMSLYRRSVTMKGAPQLISYINLCAAGIHVRLASQVGRHSDENQIRTSQAALRAVRACLSDFEENEHPNPGVAKANRVIRRMAKHFGIDPDGDAGQTGPSGMRPPSASAYSGVRATAGTDRSHRPADPVLGDQGNFDLEAFLTSFDDLNSLANLTDPSDGGLIGADVMFGFLKET